MRQVLAAGIRWGLLASNPAVLAGPNPEAAPRPVRVFTALELDAITAELPAVWQAIPAFAAATGLRPGEWAALERRHLDAARRLVRVEQKNVTATILPGGKTQGSVREVPLTQRALAALELVPARLSTTLLFASPDGHPLNLDNRRRRVWTPAAEAAGIPRPANPYALRATFASNALAAGISVFELAKLLGSSVRMVERHYGRCSTARTPASSPASNRISSKRRRDRC
jgi:integrase